MSTTTAPPLVQLKPKDFKGKVDPDWCPGCGDFGVLRSFQTVCAEMGLRPHEIVVVSGIGCSSNFPGYVSSYGMHTLHGRALAVATGAAPLLCRALPTGGSPELPSDARSPA